MYDFYKFSLENPYTPALFLYPPIGTIHCYDNISTIFSTYFVWLFVPMDENIQFNFFSTVFN